MSKRTREHEEQDDITKLDPAVQSVIEGYEGHLAQFMDSLSSLLERYNGLLQAALPHNPKAVFYYHAADGKEGTKPTDGSEASPAKKDAPAITPTTANTASFAAVPATPSGGDASLRRAPTSPLLRRPQLPAQQLEELQLEAKAELARRTSTFAFPTAAELAASHHKDRSPDLKSGSRCGSKAPSVSLPTATAGAGTPDANAKTAATSEAPHVIPPNHPLGIRTSLNKVLDKKATKEANKKAAEEVAAEGDIPSTEGDASKPPVDSATTPKKDEETDNATAASATEQNPVVTALLTRTVAEVLKDVEMPPMLLAQLRILKKESQSLMYTFDQIHDWIAMKAPAMNDSDSNQGVAIMASCISVISSISSSLQDLYDMEKEYITKRGQLEAQYVPNFECTTIRDLITATDANKWDDIEVGWRTMMRAVIIIHARLATNMKTLRTPKEKRVHHMSM